MMINGFRIAAIKQTLYLSESKFMKIDLKHVFNTEYEKQSTARF